MPPSTAALPPDCSPAARAPVPAARRPQGPQLPRHPRVSVPGRKKTSEFSRYLAASPSRYRYSFGMPGQRRTAGPHPRESWLPRLAGIGVIVLLAAGGVTGYLLAVHPGSPHHAAPLSTRVLSYATVGLIAENSAPGSPAGQLLQLLGQRDTAQFSPLGPAQAAEGSPQWTADQMAGGTYIFIFLKTGDCLTADDPRDKRSLTLEHCDLGAQQRWRRTNTPVLTQGHEFYEYANLGDGACLTQEGVRAGPVYDAGLAACAPSDPTSQLIAFWWSSA